jgi:hypothetical protein
LHILRQRLTSDIVGEPLSHDVSLVESFAFQVITEESTLVEIALHKASLATTGFFLLLLLLNKLAVFALALFRSKVPTTLDLFPLLLRCLDSFALSLDSLQFS